MDIIDTDIPGSSPFAACIRGHAIGTALLRQHILRHFHEVPCMCEWLGGVARASLYPCKGCAVGAMLVR
jgi:hypothetical protein